MVSWLNIRSLPGWFVGGLVILFQSSVDPLGGYSLRLLVACSAGCCDVISFVRWLFGSLICYRSLVGCPTNCSAGWFVCSFVCYSVDCYCFVGWVMDKCREEFTCVAYRMY